MPNSLLQVRGISKRFSGLQVLQDISFDVDEGSIVGVMGANGAGKTTLFSVIAGNNMPDRGDVVLGGRSLAGLRPDEICRRGVARTFQVVRPFGGLTVLENVVTASIFGARRHISMEQATHEALDILREVELIAHQDAKAADLTLSNQKRLEVARAVATGPSVLLLDEVMAGLTATEVARMLEIVQMLRTRRRLTVLVVEHVMQALMRLSDKIVVLHLGRLVLQGTPEEVRASKEVDQIYFGKDMSDARS
jgi:branched-chain amino acid transport system ATP-binding protein